MPIGRDTPDAKVAADRPSCHFQSRLIGLSGKARPRAAGGVIETDRAGKIAAARTRERGMSARTTCLLLGSASALALLALGWRSLGSGDDSMVPPTPRLAGSLDGPDYDIGAELGRRAGRNLFHSFERFDLRTGESATFSGPDAIRNVISRVTGGARSDIDGTLRSTIPGADFFFLNPAGVMFGPNASLDLQGSFHVSTADELRFADGAEFSATDSAASSFTVAAPEAFGFLGAEPGSITVDRSTLEVPRRRGASPSSAATSRSTAATMRSTARWQGPRRGRQSCSQSLNGPGEALYRGGEPAGGRRGDIRLIDEALVDTSGNGGGTIRIRSGGFLASTASFVCAENTGASDARQAEL